MRCFVFLASLCALALQSVAGVTVKDCSSGTSFFKVQSLSFSPDVPIAGQNGTLHSVYEVPMTITGGTTKYSCSLNGLPVFSETYDLCSQTACPITAGVHDDYSISEVPAVSGKVGCQIDWRDTAGSQLLCIQTVMNLASSEKKALRGPLPTFRQVYTPILATNLFENVTCPYVEEYALDHVFETVEQKQEQPKFHSHEDHAKMALMVLRSAQRNIIS